mgnify:CR=1 FL=1
MRGGVEQCVWRLEVAPTTTQSPPSWTLPVAAGRLCVVVGAVSNCCCRPFNTLMTSHRVSTKQGPERQPGPGAYARCLYGEHVVRRYVALLWTQLERRSSNQSICERLFKTPFPSHSGPLETLLGTILTPQGATGDYLTGVLAGRTGRPIAQT